MHCFAYQIHRYRSASTAIDGRALEQQALEVEKHVKRIPGIFSASEADLSGPLKISKPSSAALNLAPLLTRFHQRYPRIEMELQSTSALTNIGQLEADVAVRLTDSPPENLVGRRLGRLPIAVQGSEAYLRKRGFKDPAAYDWIVWQDDNCPMTMEANLKAELPHVRIALRTNSYNELYQAVCAGMGVGMLPLPISPGRQKLRALDALGTDFGIDVWMLSHPDLRKRERVNAFKQFVGGELERFLEEQRR